ncbi:MAG: NADP-dependent isocitrate dehydrogenase [Sulfurospirillaceae bacterium]
MESKIFYTKVDEAPALATYSLLPIIKAFLKQAKIEIVKKDISLAGRILANFSKDEFPDDLKILGDLTKDPKSIIIKLPNISASIPQLQAAIKELQERGYNLPNYPDEPKNEEEKKIKDRYSKILGSAVNPVLREGNSDRRASKAIKEFARKNPHYMGEWKNSSKTKVAHMQKLDFYGTEKSVTLKKDMEVSIVLKKNSGERKVLKEGLKLFKDEIVDGSFMSVDELSKFYKEQIIEAKNADLLLSLHLKATMMKISDPIMFGVAVKSYFSTIFKKYEDEFRKLGINPNNGLAHIFNEIKKLPSNLAKKVEKELNECLDSSASLAMVNSDKGITNLHFPNDVIVDASMPAMIRNGGKMWDKNGDAKECIAMIPDRSYAGVYAAVIEDCKINGAFDPKTMGSVPNVGLMAKKAQEYGSHDTTFEVEDDGVIEVVGEEVLLEHRVSKGDIWRMCRVKDEAVRDWVSLAVRRARLSNTPAIFWLDENRAHDSEIIKKVNLYLKDEDTNGLDLTILSPKEATIATLKRVREGKDTICVTGNVLRDYNTDLFPILELGTSSKMLSIVPLLNGGALFETGAGGSAPKHVEQFLKENHLRWDSLGEFLALGAALEHISLSNEKAKVLAKTLDSATEEFLNENRSPSRVVKELDTRGSHVYLAYYWVKALSTQTDDLELKDKFSKIALLFSAKIDEIIKNLNEAQGESVDMGGYYHFDDEKGRKNLRPNEEFNKIIDEIFNM